MSEQVEVNWCVYPVPLDKYAAENARHYLSFTELAYFEPEPIIPLLKEYLGMDHGLNAIMRCYSFLDYMKNVFVIRAPFDLDLSIVAKDGVEELRIKQFDQKFFDDFIQPRLGSEPYMVTLPPSYIFYSKEPVILESIPVQILHNKAMENYAHIPGVFDISKWIRPVDCTGIIKNKNAPISIRRGDIMYMVRLKTENNKQVKLIRDVAENVHINTVSSCTNLKKYLYEINLEKLYVLAKPLIRLFWKKHK